MGPEKEEKLEGKKKDKDIGRSNEGLEDKLYFDALLELCAYSTGEGQVTRNSDILSQ